MRNFLFIKLFFLVILFVNICENYAYQPPAAKVQPLYPRGLRISIPDEHGITLVAYHIKINEDFEGLEAGHIATDILKVRNGRWTYENKHVELRRDDIIYYWIHVVYQGLGYNLIDQSYRVIDFYDSNGNVRVGETVQGSQDCTTKSATWIFQDNKRWSPCPHQLIFEDNFDDLNNTKWNLVNRISDLPDDEFVVYLTNAVTDTSNGRLRIKPILLDTKYGKDFTTQGDLTVPNCSGRIGTQECQHLAFGFYILPPVISGRIDTKGKFEFLFGRIEIRAKLPHGDWVYPLIKLESTENTWETGLHREIRIAFAVGNEELRTPEGYDISGRILRAGGLTTSLNGSNAQTVNVNNRMAMPQRSSSQAWSNDFHTFQIDWKSGLITVKVDNIEYDEQIVDGSFGKPSYLTLGVAVGGVHEFQDLVTSSGYVKPWRNVERKILYNFNQAKDQWYPTWDERTLLEVDYVKVWAL